MSKKLKERNKKIINLIKGGMTFEEIGKQFGLSKQRIQQFAKDLNILRYKDRRSEKLKLIDKLKEDIHKGLTYEQIKKKYNLISLKSVINFNLQYEILKVRNKIIVEEYKTKSALEIVNSDYNNLNSIQSVYKICSGMGFKKFPMVINRVEGVSYTDRKILSYIRDKRVNKKWKYRQIASKLNDLGYMTVQGKKFTTENVHNLLKRYEKNKYKRIKK